MVSVRESNFLRDIAIECENFDIKKSYELMRISIQAQPDDEYLNKKLCDYRFRVQGQGQEALSKSVPMAFLHVPKTAGTSFRNEMVNFLGENSVIPTTYDLKSNCGLYPEPEKIEGILSDRDYVQVIVGHHDFECVSILQPQCEVMVFIRSPVERAISNLAHLRRDIPMLTQFDLLTIAKLNHPHIQYEIRNRHVSMLAGRERQDIELAKKSLDSAKFIGVTERYQESVWLSNQMFGWKLKGDLYDNRAKNVYGADVSQDLIDYMTELNQLDIELYDYAISRFESDLARFQ